MKHYSFLIFLFLAVEAHSQAIKDSMPVVVPSVTDTASVKVPVQSGNMPVATPDQIPANNSTNYNSQQNAPKAAPLKPKRKPIKNKP